MKNPRIPWILFSILLSLDIVSLLLDKVAANMATNAGGDNWSFYEQLIWQPALWASLAIGPLQLFIWTKILGKVELGLAYAISSLHMPLTMLAASVVLREQLTAQVWLGGIMITAGVIILGREKKEE